jgi:hypothetical protein
MATIAEIRTAIEDKGGRLELGKMERLSDDLHLIMAYVLGPISTSGFSRSYEQKKLNVFYFTSEAELAYFVGVDPVLLAPAVEPPAPPEPVGTDEQIATAVFQAVGTKSVKTRITHERTGAVVEAWLEEEQGFITPRVFDVLEDPDTKGLIAYQRKIG